MNYKIVSSVTQLTRRTIYTFSKSTKLVIQILSINSIVKNKRHSNPKTLKLITNHVIKKTESQLRDQKKSINRNSMLKEAHKTRKPIELSKIRRLVIQNRIWQNRTMRNNKMKLLRSNKKKVRFLEWVLFSKLASRPKNKKIRIKIIRKANLHLQLLKDLTNMSKKRRIIEINFTTSKEVQKK